MEGNEPGEARFFEFLSEEERAEFTKVAELALFGHGEVLIEEGARPSSLFILTSGQVEVYKRISGHADKLLAVLDASNENTVLGERGLLSDNEASATVRALGQVEAVKIPREKFASMIADSRPAAYKLAYRIASILAERMARNDETIVKIAAHLEVTQSAGEFELFRDKLMQEWSF
jgi:CRP-like cAMP-binding protein